MNTRKKSGCPLPVFNSNNEDKIESEPVTNADFIALVKAHECLYNPKAKNYFKRTITNKIWKDIAERCSDTEKNCRQRWNTIRTSYLNKVKGKSPYYLSDLVEFLRPYVRPCCDRPFCVHKVQTPKSSVAPKPSVDETIDLEDNNEVATLQHEDVSSTETNIQDDVPSNGEAIHVINDENLEKELLDIIKMEEDGEEQDSMKNETEQAAIDIEKHQNKNNQNENNAKDGEPSSSLSNKRKSEPVHNNNATKQPKIINSTETTLNGSSIHVMFFQSLLPFVDEMTSKENRRFKREVMNLIDDILDEKNDAA